MTRFNFNYKTASGVGSLVLEKCAETFFEKFKLLGNSVQQETPSPEFPQEIKNVGKYNSDTGKYEIDVQITGKNLFNISDLRIGKVREDGYIDSGYKNYRTIILDIKINGNYLIRFKKNTDYDRLYITAKYFNSQFSTPYLNVYTEQNAYITLKKGINILSFKAIKNGSETTFTGDSDIMISYVKDIEYEPYREPQTVTLSLDRQLTKFDKLKKIGSMWNWVFQKNVITLTGEEEWLLYDKNFYTIEYDLKRLDNAFCEFYRYTTNSSSIPDNLMFTIGAGIYSNSIFIRNDACLVKLPSGSYDISQSLANFKAHLREMKNKGTPVNIMLKKEQAEMVKLSEIEQNKINSLHTNESTTVIAVDGGEVEAGIEVEYAVKE